MVGLHTCPCGPATFPNVWGDGCNRPQVTGVISDTALCDGAQCPKPLHVWAGQAPLSCVLALCLLIVALHTFGHFCPLPPTRGGISMVGLHTCPCGPATFPNVWGDGCNRLQVTVLELLCFS